MIVSYQRHVPKFAALPFGIVYDNLDFKKYDMNSPDISVMPG